jgi:uncharacterized protein (DUF433 family)
MGEGDRGIDGWAAGILTKERLMAKEYVEKREGGFYIAGTRVSLDSVVYEFRTGSSPESIAQSFPVLRLEEVYGGITFYLANQREIDEYLKVSEKEYAKQVQEARAKDPQLYARLDQILHKQTSKS